MPKKPTEKQARRRGPKPRGPFEGKRATFTTRITPKTRAALDRVSKETGRSVSQEVEFRLEQSFRDEETRREFWGGPELEGFLKSMVGVVSIAETLTGKKMAEDAETFESVRLGWLWLLDQIAPQGVGGIHFKEAGFEELNTVWC